MKEKIMLFKIILKERLKYLWKNFLKSVEKTLQNDSFNKFKADRTA